MTEHSTSRRLLLSSMSLRRFIDGKNQFTRDIDEIDDEGKKENNTNLFAGIALDIILCDNQELAITKRLKAQKNAYLDKIKKLDEVKERVKNGETTFQEGIWELFKVMKEDE